MLPFSGPSGTATPSQSGMAAEAPPSLAFASVSLPSESSFLHFALSLSLSHQAGIVSAGIKFSKTLLASYVCQEIQIIRYGGSPQILSGEPLPSVPGFY